MYLKKKEQKSIAIYIVLSILSFIIISILILNTNTAIAKLGAKMNELAEWSDKADYYSLKIRSIGLEQSEDSNAAYKNNNQFKMLYQLLESEEGAILIDSSSFYSSMDPSKYDYEQNKCDYQLAPNCRQITINENYLKDNPIVNSKGQNIINELDHSQYTLNILVPEKYREEQEKLISLYRDYYYFNMVEVHQMYEPNYTFDIDDLKINPIYYEDNSTFFTYNPETGVQDDNQLTDIIAVIDNGTFDSSFYYSSLTSNVILKKSQTETDYFNEILSYFQEADVANQFNGLANISSSIQATINYFKSVIKYNLFVLILSILTLVYIGYVISIYKQRNNKMEYAVYYIETNDITRIIIKHLFLEGCIYLVVGTVVSYLSNSVIPLILAVLIVAFKFLIEVIIGSGFIKKNVLNIIKGER